MTKQTRGGDVSATNLPAGFRLMAFCGGKCQNFQRENAGPRCGHMPSPHDFSKAVIFKPSNNFQSTPDI